MTKVAIIGAGSAFGGRISVDILTRMGKRGVHIALCDIDKKKLEVKHAYVQRVVDVNNFSKTCLVTSSTDRKEAIKDADFVIISVAIGGSAYSGEPFESEFNIPEKYGIIQTVADTVGPGAIFRALRTAPEMIRMVEDINTLAPKSTILNLTNPMAMLTWTLTKYSKVPIVGLCHGVTGNTKKLSRLLDVPFEEVDFVCAGINHMTWYTQFMHNGVDKMDELKDIISNYKQEKKESQDLFLRSQIMKHIGYFTTESDRHIGEYVPWFQNGDQNVLIEYANITRSNYEGKHTWYEDMGIALEKANSVELNLSHEAASGIIEAIATGKKFNFSGNVLNEGFISNLPHGCCVEVPCTADANGIHAHTVGKIPTVCAALCQTNINEQTLVVEAIWEKNKEKAFHALLLDPEANTKLTLDTAKQLFDELWNREIELGIELI